MSAADSPKISFPFQRVSFSSAAFSYHTDVRAEDGLALARVFPVSGTEQSKALLIIGSYLKVLLIPALCVVPLPFAWLHLRDELGAAKALPLVSLCHWRVLEEEVWRKWDWETFLLVTAEHWLEEGDHGRFFLTSSSSSTWASVMLCSPSMGWQSTVIYP